MTDTLGTQGEPDDDRYLDGCDVDMADPAHLTADSESVDGLVMFADVEGDDDAIEQRRVDLIEWAAGQAGDGESTTGAPDA